MAKAGGQKESYTMLQCRCYVYKMKVLLERRKSCAARISMRKERPSQSLIMWY